MVANFRPQRKNANKHTQRGQGMLQKSIQTDGWISAITTTADGEAIDGSLRLETAYEVFGDIEPIVIESNGDRPIIHIRKDIPSADTEQARRLSISANRTPEVSLDWDFEVLEEWQEDIDMGEFWRENEWLNEQSDAIADEETELDIGMGDHSKKEIECVCPSCGHEFVKQM